jgi:hypothetical protein
LLAPLLVVVCGLYGWTFATQHRFEQGYRELTSLRAQIRQMSLLSDALAGDLPTDTAVPSGLGPAALSQDLPLPAQPERPFRPPGTHAALTLLHAPVGY